MKFLLFACASIWLLGSCQPSQDRASPPLFDLLPSSHTNIRFNNLITETETFNIIQYEYIYNGGGVAVGDVNNDGLPDLYFTGSQVSGRLYLNRGNLQFEDVTQAAKVGTSQWSTGVAMVDLNADGRLDIYICGANPTERTKGQKMGHNLLFINQGVDGKGVPIFSELAAEYGLQAKGYNTQSAFFDYDRDGDLDMYLLSNAIELFNRNTSRYKKINGEGRSTDRLFRNEGNGKFTDVSALAGIRKEGYGLGVVVADINADGWPDVYAANDFLSNDLLYINNQDGTFTDSASQYFKYQSYNSMGVDIADYNNDALADIMVVDMLPQSNERQKRMLGMHNYDKFALNLSLGYAPQFVHNVLQINNGRPPFSEIAQFANVAATDWSWSTLFCDLDNDGLKDLFVTNGYRKDITDLDYILYSGGLAQFGTRENADKLLYERLGKVPEVKIANYLFQNQGNLTFEDASNKWGFVQPAYSNGAAYADLDDDGDLDLVINNIDDEAFVYRNNANNWLKNNFLKIKFEGNSANRFGLGASVKLKYKGQQQLIDNSPTRGYLSCTETILHAGLGKTDRIDSVEVYWPDGRYQLLTNVVANQTLTAKHSQSSAPPRRSSPNAPMFTPVQLLNYQHQSSPFIDFKVQPLLPHAHSQNGPGLTVGDINGDGREDIYVGGTYQKRGALFTQNRHGVFVADSLPNDKFSYGQDMGALLFDADNDHDLDLYIASGGSEFSPNSKHYRHRFYRNNGKGKLLADTSALPPFATSGAAVTAADYDRDGDLDIFVAGRLVPHQYPLVPQSFLLRNDGGKFTDVTDQLAPGLSRIGLVSAAIWTDVDNDLDLDLLLAGEWMPLTLFENNEGKFVNATANVGLSNTQGWWNSLIAADFDHDGDMDYLAGNAGLNTQYRASMAQPISLYAKDYDENGSLDPVMARYVMGQNCPVPTRDMLIDQLVGMRKRFPTYQDYAMATLTDVFSAEELAGALFCKSVTLQSSYIENKGNSPNGPRFEITPLPLPVQMAPVHGMVCQDYDQDGQLDVLIVGNSYANETVSGWNNASNGLFLRGNGKGGFSVVRGSGFWVPGDGKALAEFALTSGGSLLVATQNNDFALVFGHRPLATGQVVTLHSTDAYAVIRYMDGTREKREFSYGDGYLSQSSRVLRLGKTVQSAEIYQYTGQSRKVTIQYPRKNKR